MKLRTALENYYLPDRVFNRRWLLPIIFVILLSIYVALNTLTTAQQLGAIPNVWDIIVAVLNGRTWFHHGLTNLLIYLVSEIALFGDSSFYLVSRIESRWNWFQMLVLCTFFAVIGYLLLLSVILLGVTLPLTTWSLSWSPAALPLLEQQELPATSLLELAPLPTVIGMLVLLGLTWTGIGIVVTVVTAKTQNAIYGFIVGLALNYSTFLLWMANIQIPVLDLLWFHQYQLLWQSSLLSESLLNFIWRALAYWSLWIILGLIVLYKVCRSLDILS